MGGPFVGVIAHSLRFIVIPDPPALGPDRGIGHLRLAKIMIIIESRLPPLTRRQTRNNRNHHRRHRKVCAHLGIRLVPVNVYLLSILFFNIGMLRYQSICNNRVVV